MKLWRIRSYLQTGEFTTCEHLYHAETSSAALERFRRDYPAHNSCIIVCEEYNPDETPEHFAACLRCGCVHYW